MLNLLQCQTVLMKRLQLGQMIYIQLNCFWKLICRDIKFCSFNQFNCKSWCFFLCVSRIWYPSFAAGRGCVKRLRIRQHCSRHQTLLIKSSDCWDTSIIHHMRPGNKVARKSSIAQLSLRWDDVCRGWGACWRLNIILWELSFEEFRSLACFVDLFASCSHSCSARWVLEEREIYFWFEEKKKKN